MSKILCGLSPKYTHLCSKRQMKMKIFIRKNVGAAIVTIQSIVRQNICAKIRCIFASMIN